jgi:hypothetical protein
MMRLAFFSSLFLCAHVSLRADSSLMFNEIMFHPSSSETTGEWVEFYNQLAVDLDVSGWAVTGGIEYSFPSNTIVRGGGYIVLALAPDTIKSQTGLTNVLGPFGGRLSNSGEELQLRNNNNRVVDSVSYGVDGDWPVAPNGAGVSLVKRAPDSTSAPAENWAASEQIGGTPGTRNFTEASGFPVPPGLVSYWNFNEANGTTAFDQAGQNQGMLGSGVTRTMAGIGRALSFNTTNAYVNVGPGNNHNLDVSGGITIEAVILPGWSGTNSAVIFKKALRQPGNYQDAVLANNPAAYWRLGGSTTTILDGTVNGRHGSATAGVLLNQPGLVPSDPTNTAVRASGYQRVTIPGFEKIGPGGYTIEYWLKVHQLPGGCCQNLVGDGESGGDFFMMNYILGPDQGQPGAIRPHYGLGNSPISLDSETVLEAGKTYHVVTTWDANTATDNAVIYLNGAADLTGTVTRIVPATGTSGNNSVYIGYDNREVPQGDFTYDEVAIYSHPLTASDVSVHYAAAMLTNFSTSLGNAIQLAFQNDGNNSQANPPVAGGPVLSFGLTIGGVYSELDMPLDGLAGRPTLAHLENGLPHHVAATYNSATGLKALYVDGVLCFSTMLNGTLDGANSANAILGNSEVNGSEPFAGVLDELAYWSRPLTSQEISSHFAAMQAGSDYFGSADASPTFVFNELSAATNAQFWLELANHGVDAVSPAGCVIICDGVVDTEYIFPTSPTIAGGGLLTVTSATLGFTPATGDKLFLLSPGRNKVLDAVAVKQTGLARSPDASGTWWRPAVSTPGEANSFAFHKEIVINEIMYHHFVLPATNGLPPQASEEAWIELFNKSTNSVNLAGWKLDGGIHFDFLTGTIIPPGGYLVVAKDATALQALYPAINVAGNFNGRLSRGGDLIVLKDAMGNPASKVHYHDGGRWPAYADGGGSSLELRDPDSDTLRAEAWAASDETGKSGWKSYSYRMTAQSIVGPQQWNDFIMGLLASGECLVDDISVIESPSSTAVEFIANGDFENGLTGWRVTGTHNRSRVTLDPDNPANHVLHISSTGPQEHMHNHIETTYRNGRTVTDGREYQISFRAKWLAGNNLLNTRLYFNRVARTTALPVPALNGTPGTQNSRFTANIGPTFSQFMHSKVIPQPGELVTVSVVAQDPQGVNACNVFWSVNGGAWLDTAMTPQGDGLYVGTIPGYLGGTIVQFYVRATDNLGVSATYPAGGADSGALYAVADGQANLNLGHNLRILLAPANTALLHAFTNVQSNDNLPCTVIYDEKRAYYDAGVRLKGSQRGRYSNTRVSFHLQFQPDDLFCGVHPVMLVDRSGAGDGEANKQQEILVRHMLLRAGGLPGTQPDMCRVIAPMSAHTGPAILTSRLEDDFIKTAYENGGDGNEFELELIYYPITANAAGYKFPQPDNVIGTDITDLGGDKEIYRYNFILKNHRNVDDYRQFMQFAKALSLPSGSLLDARTRQVMDVDEWARAYALISLCGVADTYTFGYEHNLLMYVRPSDQRMLAFPWDMDFSFYQWTDGPLIGSHNAGKVLSLPANRRALYGHALDIMGSAYNTSYMSYWVSHYQGFAPGQNYSGVLGYIQNRRAAVHAEIANAGGNTQFAVNGSTNFTTAANLVTLTGTAPVWMKTIKINGVEYPVTWNSISSWRIDVPVASIANELNVTGYDLHGNSLTNVLVSVNYTGPVPSPVGHVVFNEIMYNPPSPETSYVELFNTSSNASFDLSGWRINGLDYTFPAGSLITNQQFLVLTKNLGAFGGAYNQSLPAFGQFAGNLQVNGETLTLLMPGSQTNQQTIVDQVRYEASAPWPIAAPGVSLQLIDAGQDNSRVANWVVGQTASAPVPQWVSYSATGTITSSRLYLYLESAGDIYVDDIKLVAGSVPDTGLNVISNGDFETSLTGSWNLTANFAQSAINTNVKHSGNGSLGIVTAAGGTGSGNAIYQDITPSLPLNTTYTLSFWYLQTTNGGPLTVRLSSSGIVATVDPAPATAASALSTPGAANSVATVLPPFPHAWLNEVQADNITALTDNFSEHDPWVEIYNAGTNTLSLAGFYLSDNYTNLTRWAFPTNASIAAGAFAVVWCDAQTNQTTTTVLHANFRLSSGSGRVALTRLTNNSPQLIDYHTYTGLPSNWSYGDLPDGQPITRGKMFTVTPGTTNSAASAPITVFINEWMADNATALADPADGDFEDWFEIYNPGTNSVDLGGYYLSANLADKTKFLIPNNGHYTIPPLAYLLVWADSESSQNNLNRADLHVNFKLSKSGEAIGIFAADGTAIDAVTFGAQLTGISEGRFPNGGATRFFMPTPTPRAANVIPNTAPVLDFINDRLVHRGQTVLLTASAADAESEFQILTFSLDAGAPEGAAVNPVSGAFSWTTTNAVAPGTNAITVRVTDNGVPPLNYSRLFYVVVQPTPQLGNVQYTADQLTLSFASLLGQTYQLQFKDNLGDAVWIPLGSPAAGTGASLELSDALTGQTERYYRLIIMP